MADLTDEQMDTIDPTDDERAYADAHVAKTHEPNGKTWAVSVESTPDMFIVVQRWPDDGRGEEMAEEHRQGIANVIADLLAMRRVGL